MHTEGNIQMKNTITQCYKEQEYNDKDSCSHGVFHGYRLIIACYDRTGGRTACFIHVYKSY